MLIVIVATVSRNGRLDSKVRQMRVEELQCKWACRAGIETAIALLNEDTRESDHLMDFWSYNEEDFNDVALDGCVYNVRVVDESSKLNINTVTKEQLMALPYMEEYIADAILDWRDSNDTPSGMGVESGYYGNLKFPYPIRNGPFRTVRELLLVKDVTEDLFYGEDRNLNGKLDDNERDGDASPPLDNKDNKLDLGWFSFLTCYSYDKNVDAEGNTKLNINQANASQLQESLGISSADAQLIVQKRSSSQFTSIADLISASTSASAGGGPGNSPGQSATLNLQTFYDIADKITVNSQQQTPGKININTAPKEVLAALLEASLGSEAQAEQIAENIVASRAGSLYGMQSISELLELGLVDVDTFRQIANSITTRSDVFTIRCFATAARGTDTGITLQAEAVVDRSSSPCKILYWYEGVSN